MEDFSSWMQGIVSRSHAVEIVHLNDVAGALQDVHSLLQDHSDQQPMFNKIYDQVKCLAESAAPQDSAELEQAYTTLVTRYQVNITDTSTKYLSTMAHEFLCYLSMV